MSARSKKSKKSGTAASPGVNLPEGLSASGLLHRLLYGAVERFPELRTAEFPVDPRQFRRGYADAIVRFEAARVASSARTDIAAWIADEAHASFRNVDAEGRATSLTELFAREGEPMPTRRTVFPAPAGLRPRVPFRGADYEGEGLRSLGDTLVERALATRAVADSLAGLAARVATTGAALDLSGRRVAVLGAAAELSPVRMLLTAGAEVLWIDRAPPPPELLAARDLAGALTYTERPADLLVEPREVAATIARFAGDAGADLVLTAYAPGGGREWRLAAAMNAIARALDPGIVRSVGTYISPTTPATILAHEAERAAHRASHGPAWQRALAATGVLPPASHALGGVRVARALVPVQGVGYQAAQYVEKMLAAERFAFRGTRDGSTPPRVSANVAPITATRSLEHPVFQAGFLKAAQFGVEIFASESTQTLAGLLWISDVLGPPPAAPDALFGRQVHGGVYAMAYALHDVIRLALVLSIATRPSLLLELARRR